MASRLICTTRVITDFTDDHPVDFDRCIASASKTGDEEVRAPFIIFDADIVLHQTVFGPQRLRPVYLHCELSPYPNPYDIIGTGVRERIPYWCPSGGPR